MNRNFTYDLSPPRIQQRIRNPQLTQWVLYSSRDFSAYQFRLYPEMNSGPISISQSSQMNVLYSIGSQRLRSSIDFIPAANTGPVTGSKRLREREMFLSRFSNDMTTNPPKSKWKQARYNQSRISLCNEINSNENIQTVNLRNFAKVAPCHDSCSISKEGNNGDLEQGDDRRPLVSQIDSMYKEDDFQSQEDEESDNEFESDVNTWLHCNDDWWKPEYVNIEANSRN